MLHYGIPHTPVHETGAGGQALAHVDADAASQADYAQWLHMSAPQDHMAPAQAAQTQQGFVQDAYSVPPPSYYTQSTEQGNPAPSPTAPADPAQAVAYQAQDGYGFFLYAAQPQTPQEQVYSYDGQQMLPVDDAAQQTQHMLSSPTASYAPESYELYAHFQTPPAQSMQMAMFSSSSPIERQPQPAPPPQPPVLSTPRPRSYPHSANPLRPSRLRQVSNYDDDVPEPDDVPDHDTQATTFDERLSSVSLVTQQSQSLAFALASPVKFDPAVSVSANPVPVAQPSPALASGEQAQMQLPDSLPPSAPVPTSAGSQSLYDALFNSEGTSAPIVTGTSFDTHPQEQVAPLAAAWAQQQDSAMTSLAVDSNVPEAPLAPVSAISALAGAVLDEFDVRSLEKAIVATAPGIVSDMDVDFDIDHDADGETEPAVTPGFTVKASPDDVGGSNNGNNTMLTGTTLVDEDQFFWQDEQAKYKGGFVATEAQMEADMQTKPESMELSEDMLKVANEILASSPPEPPTSFVDLIPEILVAAPQEPEAGRSTPEQSSSRPTRSESENDALAALTALATPRTNGRVQAAPVTPAGTIPPSAPSSASVPLAAATRRGGKRKRGSATSSPARSRLQSPMPSASPRRRFPAAPIAFHVGPTDDVDPRNRYRTRSKLPGIDAEMDEKEKDHDLFVIRGGVFDHIPNGARIKQAATRTRASKGSENAGARSATASRAASVATGSSPAPGAAGSSRAHTRSKKARTAAMVDVKSVAQPSLPAVPPAPAPVAPEPAAAPAPAPAPPVVERPKRELPKRSAAQPASARAAALKPLYTNVPQVLPQMLPQALPQALPPITTTFSRGSSPLTPSPVQAPAQPVQLRPQPQPSTSTSTFAIQPISVPTFPARTHASLEYHAPHQISAQPKRSPARRSPAKNDKKRKRAPGVDDADEDIHALLDELEEDRYSDFTGPSTSKRVRRNVLIAPAVPPRSNAALPPIAPAPATPAESTRSWPSPLTPLTDLPSSSPPPAPPAVQSHPAPGPGAAPRLHAPPPTAEQGRSAAASPTASVAAPQKRPPRRQPAVPQFSSSTPRAAVLPVPTGPMLAPMASSSAMTLDGTVPAIAPDEAFPMLHPAESVMKPDFRSFPPEMELRTDFPLWYRRFPLIGVFRPWDPMGDAVLGTTARPKGPAGATFNNPTTIYDLYTPRFVKGTGREKQGMCPICAEPPERGGEGKQHWFAMKVSAFNYHMQNAHGVSASLKLPFSPPIEFRSAKRTVSGRHEKDAVLEGKCHQCSRFIPLEGVKLGDIKVKEIYWWKHVAKCHQSNYSGECDLYYEDDVLLRVKAFEERERAAALRNAIDRSVGMPPRMVAAPGYPGGYLVQVAPGSAFGNPVPVQAMGQVPYGHTAVQAQYPMAPAHALGPVAGPSNVQHMSPISPMTVYPTQRQHPHAHAHPHAHPHAQHAPGSSMMPMPHQVAPVQHSHMVAAPMAQLAPAMVADPSTGYVQAPTSAISALPPPLQLPQQPME
ncbi:hypothetical protein AURDEDRAFT_180943 [Auricularia subglabra TFB-10046 SS5]|nr:hypothetical protein AURDEDRAFT_180943 [Auricularia subglabra TFB-10046 SS5]